MSAFSARFITTILALLLVRVRLSTSGIARSTRTWRVIDRCYLGYEDKQGTGFYFRGETPQADAWISAASLVAHFAQPFIAARGGIGQEERRNVLRRIGEDAA